MKRTSKYWLLMIATILGLAGGVVHADDDEGVQQDSATTDMTATVKSGGLQLLNVNTSVDFSRMSLSQLFNNGGALTANNSTVLTDTDGYQVAGAAITGNVENYTSNGNWQLMATFTGFRKATTDDKGNDVYDPNGALLKAQMQLFGVTLSADTPTTVIEGGKTYGMANKSDSQTRVTANAFGETKLADLNVVPIVTVYRQAPALGRYMGQINYELTQDAGAAVTGE
jgi:hypothetical protein